MKSSKTIRVILKDQAREEYEKLSRVVKEQQKKGKTNSEEMQMGRIYQRISFPRRLMLTISSEWN